MTCVRITSSGVWAGEGGRRGGEKSGRGVVEG